MALPDARALWVEIWDYFGTAETPCCNEVGLNEHMNSFDGFRSRLCLQDFHLKMVLKASGGIIECWRWLNIQHNPDFKLHINIRFDDFYF